MLESDTVVYGVQVTNINNQAAKYMNPNGPDGSGYLPVVSEIVGSRMTHVEERLLGKTSMVKPVTQRFLLF